MASGDFCVPTNICASDKCVTTPNCTRYKPYHICVRMCNKNVMCLLLATHEKGFDLSSHDTRVNQIIRSLLQATWVSWLKIYWVKCSPNLCVHSYKLRLWFCVVFCLVRAVCEFNCRLLTIKTLNKQWQLAETSVFDKTCTFSCVVSTGITDPFVIKVTAVPMSLQQCPVSCGFILYILIPKSLLQRPYQLKLKIWMVHAFKIHPTMSAVPCLVPVNFKL
jgi:hypothetical protein